VDASGALAGRTVAAVAAGGYYSLALTSDGRLFAWGQNGSGQLGDGSTTQRLSPVAVDVSGALAGRVVASVDAGANHSLAVTTDGRLLAWGSSGFGLLGDGFATRRTSPVAVDSSGVLAGRTIAAVTAGALHSLALTTDGRLFAWGRGFEGQLGAGFAVQRNAPVAVDTTGALAGREVAAVGAGANHSLALTTDGGLFAWGYNSFGQLGDGSINQRDAPVAVDTTGLLAGKAIVAVAGGFEHSLALSSDGRLFAWGYNVFGQLGDGTATNRTVPVAVDVSGALAGKTIAAVAAGAYHSLALTSGGQLFSWGNNGNGQLGDASTLQRSAPVAVDLSGALAGKTIAAVAAGAYHSLALTTDGQLFGWGLNVDGGLGDGTTTQRQAPVLIAAGFSAISAGSTHSLGLASDGALFAFGGAAQGQLGDGRGQLQPLPAQVFLPPRPVNLTYAPTVMTVTVGGTIPANAPTWVGTATDFSVSPTLPAGLTLDPVTGVVSGTPSATSPTTTYRVTATGPSGATVALLTITVD